MTFVDRFNMTVFRIQNDINHKVFYSCGDINFSYDLTKLFVGPDYKLKQSSLAPASNTSEDL